VGQGTAEKRKKTATHTMFGYRVCVTQTKTFSFVQCYKYTASVVTSYIDILWKKGTSDVVPLPDSKCGEEGTSHVMSPFI
jgi:hypothetical protein